MTRPDEPRPDEPAAGSARPDDTRPGDGSVSAVLDGTATPAERDLVTSSPELRARLDAFRAVRDGLRPVPGEAERLGEGRRRSHRDRARGVGSPTGCRRSFRCGHHRRGPGHRRSGRSTGPPPGVAGRCCGPGAGGRDRRGRGPRRRRRPDRPGRDRGSGVRPSGRGRTGRRLPRRHGRRGRFGPDHHCRRGRGAVGVVGGRIVGGRGRWRLPGIVRHPDRPRPGGTGRRCRPRPPPHRHASRPWPAPGPRRWGRRSWTVAPWWSG